jgi:hypothetical protein
MHKLYHRIKIRLTSPCIGHKTPWIAELEKATIGPTLVMNARTMKTRQTTKKDKYPVLKVLQGIYNICYIAYDPEGGTDITFYLTFKDMNLEGLQSLIAELDSNEICFIGICSDIVVKGDIMEE